MRAIRRRGDGSLGFDGEGAALDWVVEMRRFDAAGLFDRLAETGAARRQPLLRELADVIAAFHAAAERLPEFGGSAGIVEGDRRQRRTICVTAGAALDRDAVSRARRGRARGARRDSRICSTAAGGAARCGAATAICISAISVSSTGKPTLFDAIEFSAEIASIDVLYDLAFLLMDLLHRKLASARTWCSTAISISRATMKGCAALPLFLSLRAAIRAHVAAAAVAQQRTAAQRRRKEAAAPAAISRSPRRCSLPAQPRLIAIGGRSGSGKSTLAQALAPDIAPAPGARVLRSDVLRKAMLDLPPEAPLPADAYSRAMGRQVYAVMQHETARALDCGASVIMDATFLDPDERAAAAQLAANAGVPFTGIWLDTRREIMAARLKARRGDASDATIAVLEQQLAGDVGAMDWRRIDSGSSLPRVLAALRRAVGLALPGAHGGAARRQGR